MSNKGLTEFNKNKERLPRSDREALNDYQDFRAARSRTGISRREWSALSKKTRKNLADTLAKCSRLDQRLVSLEALSKRLLDNP